MSESVADPVRLSRTALDKLRPSRRFSTPPRCALELNRELFGVPESITTIIAPFGYGLFAESDSAA